MNAYDYYRSLDGATKADIDAIAIQVRQQARHDIALLLAWNIWLCGALDVARSLAREGEKEASKARKQSARTSTTA